MCTQHLRTSSVPSFKLATTLSLCLGHTTHACTCIAHVRRSHESAHGNTTQAQTCVILVRQLRCSHLHHRLRLSLI